MPDPRLAVTVPDGSVWRAPSLASADRERVRWGGFEEFGRIALPHVPLVRDPHWSWHHVEVCRHYQALIDGTFSELFVNVPPGCTKSGLVSVLGPAWVWTRDPSFQFMSASFDDSNATKHAGWTAEIMQGRWYVERWGNLLVDATNRREYFTCANGYRFSTSAPHGKGTGRHCDLYSIDDPLKAEDARARAGKDLAAALSAVNDWIGGSVLTRAAGERQAICLVMQRLHELDACGFLLDKFEGLDTTAHLRLPYMFEPENRCVTAIGGDWRTVAGEIIWERKPRSLIDRIARANGGWNSLVMQAQYQQNPSPIGGSIFQASTFRDFRPC